MQARLYKDLSELANHALQDARTLKGILNLIQILDSNFEVRSIRLRLNDDLDDLGDLGDLCSILGFFAIYCFYFHKNVKIKQRNDDTSEKMQN